ncbi:hypothetical protein KSP40_PGU017501 [Platanthera guangdongensis]|uniref:DNA topoisomerase n=1 Tax=Platanthera guangdongensis TaxID=2320717 RepID=A0ABR2MRA5_9ASPA
MFSLLLYSSLSSGFLPQAFAQVCSHPCGATIGEIDLRIGASFTRFQTMLLRDAFVLDLVADDRNIVLSYGPCQVAEELYQAGFISYPRTETDGFSVNTDLQAIVRDQLAHPTWGSYAERLLDPEARLWRNPSNGGHDDKAHPPIHPTKSSSDFYSAALPPFVFLLGNSNRFAIHPSGLMRSPMVEEKNLDPENDDIKKKHDQELD